MRRTWAYIAQMNLKLISRTKAWVLFAAWFGGTVVAVGLLGMSSLKPQLRPDLLFILSENTFTLYFVFLILLVLRGRNRNWEVICRPSPSAVGWLLVCFALTVVALVYAALYSGAGAVTQMDGQWYRVGGSLAPTPITLDRAVAYMWGNIQFHAILMVPLSLAGMPVFGSFPVPIIEAR